MAISFPTRYSKAMGVMWSRSSLRITMHTACAHRVLGVSSLDLLHTITSRMWNKVPRKLQCLDVLALINLFGVVNQVRMLVSWFLFYMSFLSTSVRSVRAFELEPARLFSSLPFFNYTSSALQISTILNPVQFQQEKGALTGQLKHILLRHAHQKFFLLLRHLKSFCVTGHSLHAHPGHHEANCIKMQQSMTACIWERPHVFHPVWAANWWVCIRTLPSVISASSIPCDAGVLRCCMRDDTVVFYMSVQIHHLWPGAVSLNANVHNPSHPPSHCVTSSSRKREPATNLGSTTTRQGSRRPIWSCHRFPRRPRRHCWMHGGTRPRGSWQCRRGCSRTAF
jgi:hypothetical protein